MVDQGGEGTERRSLRGRRGRVPVAGGIVLVLASLAATAIDPVAGVVAGSVATAVEAVGIALVLYGVVLLSSRDPPAWTLAGPVACVAGVGVGVAAGSVAGIAAVGLYASGIAVLVAALSVGARTGGDRETGDRGDSPGRDPAGEGDHPGRPDDPEFAVEAEKASDGWRWRLVGREGEAVAVGRAGRDSRPAALAAVRDALRSAESPPESGSGPDSRPGERDDAPPWTTGVPESDPVDSGEDEHTGTFELHEDDGWRWRFRHPGGIVLARSNTAVEDREAVERAVEWVRGSASDAGTLVYDPAGIEVFREGEGWNWRLRHVREGVLATGTNACPSRGAVMAAIERVKSTLDAEPTVETDDGSWRLVEDGEAVARSVAAVEFDRVRPHLREAGVVVLDPAGFAVVELEGGTWGWRLRESGGEVVAESGGHTSRKRATEGLRSFVRQVPGAVTVVRDETTTRAIEDAMADAALARTVVERGEAGSDSTPEDGGDADPERGETGDCRPSENADGSEGDGIGAKQRGTAAGSGAEGSGRAGRNGTGSQGRDEGGTGGRGEDGTQDQVEGGNEDGSDDTGHPGDPVPTDGRDADAQVRNGGIEVREADGWRWGIRRDDRTVASALHRYPDREAATAAAREADTHLDAAGVVTVDPAAVEVYPDGEEHRWRLVAADGSVLAVAAAPFDDPGAARAAVEELPADADFEVYRDDGWRWRLRRDGRVVAVSPRGYEAIEDARVAFGRVEDLLPEAPAVECDAAVELAPGEVGWVLRIRDPSGSVVAAGDGFDSGAAARAAADDLVSPGPAIEGADE